MTDLTTIKQGDTIDAPGLGPRKVSKARKAQRCWGWAKPGGDHIKPGTLYVRTEPTYDYHGDFAGSHCPPCCLDCLSD